MNIKVSLGVVVAIMMLVAAVTFTITMSYSRNVFNDKVSYLREREDLYDKFTEIDRQVRMNYLGSINETQLMDSVARGYIQGVGDPYAMYISAEEYQRLTSAGSGSAGIGAALEVGTDGYLMVTEVYDDSSAQLEGIQPGDQIVKVEDTDLTMENAAQMLTEIETGGGEGTRVTLTVRQGTEDMVMELTRRLVTAPTVSSRVLEGTSVGYLWIREFNDNTSDQFNRELQKLQDSQITALIFDLRDNKGGTLKSATRIMDKLLPAGPLVSVQYKGDTEAEVLYDSDANEVSMPMVVLVNGETASSAELFAHAIRDYNKGYLVGTTTAGKGVVQEIIKLTDGSAIDLTVGYYYPPSGEDFNETGIKPDYEVSLDGDWTALDESEDTQLKKAIEVAVSSAGRGGAQGQGSPDTAESQPAGETGPEEGQEENEENLDPGDGEDSPEESGAEDESQPDEETSEED